MGAAVYLPCPRTLLQLDDLPDYRVLNCTCGLDADHRQGSVPQSGRFILFSVKRCSRVFWQALLVAPVVLCFTIFAGIAATRFDEWLSIPEHQGGLVIATDFLVSQVTIADQANKPFQIVKWNQKFPFIHQVRLKPSRYFVELPGPSQQRQEVDLEIKAGSLTYLSFNPRGTGTHVELSYGKARFDVGKLLDDAFDAGNADAFSVTSAEPLDSVLVLSTEPPWPIPPPPPPPPKQ